MAEFMMANSKMLPEGSSMVTLLVTNVLPMKENAKQGTPNFMGAICLEREPVEISYRKKKVRNADDREEWLNMTDDDGNDKARLEFGMNLYVGLFDQPALKLINAPCIIRAGMTASVYNGKASYRVESVMKDSILDALNMNNFEKYVVGTSIAKIPTVETFDETGAQYISFIVPFSGDNKWYPTTEIMFESSNPERMHYLTSTKPVEHDVGLSRADDDKVLNQFVMNLIPSDPKDDRQYGLYVGYERDMFKSFGVIDLSNWERAGPRLISCCRNTMIACSSSAERTRRIPANSAGDDVRTEEGRKLVATAAFATRLVVDLAETAKSAGLPLTVEHCKRLLLAPTNTFRTDVAKHPINANFEDRVAFGRDRVILNLSEIPRFYLQTLFDSIEEREDITYWGVYSRVDNSVYELDGENISEQLEENTTQNPVVIFCIIPPK